MAKSPDPTLKLSTSTGVTRTLDDWSTMFHLCLVILPERPEASRWMGVAERIFRVFGDADCHTGFVVTGPESIAERVVTSNPARAMVFVDPDKELVRSLGLERLPAFVHLRQDTSLVASTEGWDLREWRQVAREAAKSMAWTTPEISGPDDPPRFAGWPVEDA